MVLKALFKVPKICNINFWIEKDPPLWNFSENSSALVAWPVPNTNTSELHFARSFQGNPSLPYLVRSNTRPNTPNMAK